MLSYRCSEKPKLGESSKHLRYTQRTSPCCVQKLCGTQSSSGSRWCVFREYTGVCVLWTPVLLERVTERKSPKKHFFARWGTFVGLPGWELCLASRGWLLEHPCAQVLVSGSSESTFSPGFPPNATLSNDRYTGTCVRRQLRKKSSKECPEV